MAGAGDILDGRYRVVGRIGHGATSEVFLVESLRLGTRWVIKAVDRVIAPGMDLLAEPNILKRLNHPHLPRIIDVFQEQQVLYLVMDYVEGQPMAELVRQEGPQPEPRVIRWATQLCDVLAYLHAQEPHPIIYRDMKPDNIMVDPGGNVRVVDFGIAREARQGRRADTVPLGTRGYAAPEQYGEAGPTGPWTDIYGLGATLYHLLTGQPPAAGHAGIQAGLSAAGVSPGLAGVILRATRPGPDQRYAGAAEMRQALEQIGMGGGGLALPGGRDTWELVAPGRLPAAAPEPPDRGRPAALSAPAPAEPTEPGGRGRVVALWSPRPGSGQTTLICHLALAAAAAGCRVVTADLDPWNSNLAVRAGCPGSRGGLSAALRAVRSGWAPDAGGDRAGAGASGGALPGVTPSAAPGWDLLPGAPAPASPAQQRPAEDMAGLAACLAAAYGLVLLDTGSRLSDPGTWGALCSADAVVILVTPEPAALADAEAYIGRLLQEDGLAGRCHLALGSYAARWHVPPEQVAEMLGLSPVAAVPFLPAPLGQAARAGRLLGRGQGESTGYWRAVDTLLRTVCGWQPAPRPWWRQVLGGG